MNTVVELDEICSLRAIFMIFPRKEIFLERSRINKVIVCYFLNVPQKKMASTIAADIALLITYRCTKIVSRCILFFI